MTTQSSLVDRILPAFDGIWKQREAVATHNQSRLGWFDFSLFFSGYFDRSSSCHCKRLFATFPIPHTFKGPLSRLQYEVQRPVLPTPNQCWCISESSSSDVSSSSPCCFSVITSTSSTRFSFHGLALVRRIFEITC